MRRVFRISLAIMLSVFTGLLVFYLIQQNRYTGAFANGADISWVLGMEQEGITWKDKNGVTRDIFDILKNDYNINAVRIRSWVNPSDDPSNGLMDQEHTIALAKRAKKAGLRVMIDLHYSDTWADPGKQYTPSAWADMDIDELCDRVYTYTRNFMQEIVKQGITPEWIQIGNEINKGMLWPLGRMPENHVNLARLITAGHDAVKSVSKKTKTIVHLSDGYDIVAYRSFFDTLTCNNARFDLIGMSLYPSESDWQSKNELCYKNMLDMKSRYEKDVIICEIGMHYTSGKTARNFIADLVSKSKSAGGLGVFYWEPQCIYSWNTYDKGAWNNDGTPTEALEGFIENAVSKDIGN